MGMCVGLLVGMGDTATKAALEWALGCTDAVRACAEVTRSMNDLASFKHGKNKNDVASSVECYISEHGVASEDAIAKTGSLIEDAWKTTNQARFELPELLLPAVQRVANITINIPFM
ncbi:tau-cadinol synthase-like [Aegilops tauschii subsp. strangulata]|uniref:(+)-delta-cadinene synthase isozyme A n=1 Tax=Aegilops tauschii TaxID=37682 RepID=M8B8J3_AEGTA|nr:tau-cadinol synthase-like [Triticum aestivum]